MREKHDSGYGYFIVVLIILATWPRPQQQSSKPSKPAVQQCSCVKSTGTLDASPVDRAEVQWHQTSKMIDEALTAQDGVVTATIVTKAKP